MSGLLSTWRRNVRHRMPCGWVVAEPSAAAICLDDEPPMALASLEGHTCPPQQPAGLAVASAASTLVIPARMVSNDEHSQGGRPL